jgi:hypothetical protein
MESATDAIFVPPFGPPTTAVTQRNKDVSSFTRVSVCPSVELACHPFHTARTNPVAELCFGMLGDVALQLVPGVAVIADFLAIHANRDNPLERPHSGHRYLARCFSGLALCRIEHDREE